MAEKHKAKTLTADLQRAVRLWIGMLLPPIVWAAQLQTVYLTSEWACYAMDLTWNHVASIVALLVSMFALWVAYIEWKATAGGTDDEGYTGERRRFMAVLGLLGGALFIALIFATWLPTLMGVPCSK
jgi:hypothetical protein